MYHALLLIKLHLMRSLRSALIRLVLEDAERRRPSRLPLTFDRWN